MTYLPQNNRKLETAGSTFKGLVHCYAKTRFQKDLENLKIVQLIIEVFNLKCTHKRNDIKRYFFLLFAGNLTW